MFHPACQTNECQRLNRAPLAFLVGDLGVQRWQLRVFQRRRAREQIESLKTNPIF